MAFSRTSRPPSWERVAAWPSSSRPWRLCGPTRTCSVTWTSCCGAAPLPRSALVQSVSERLACSTAAAEPIQAHRRQARDRCRIPVPGSGLEAETAQQVPETRIRADRVVDRVDQEVDPEAPLPAGLLQPVEGRLPVSQADVDPGEEERQHELAPGALPEPAHHLAGFVLAPGDAEAPADEGEEERGAAAGRLGASQLHERFLVAAQRGQGCTERRLPELRIEALRPARVLDGEEVIARPVGDRRRQR